MKKGYLFLILLFIFSFNGFSQTALPVSRTSWSAAPAGWTDNLSGIYNSALACDGNSNRGKFGANNDNTQVFFSGVPGALSFDLQGNGIGATSSLLVEESPDGSTWSTVATISGISGSCVTYNYTLTCTSTYVKWTYTKVSGNLAIDNVSIATGICGGGGGGSTTCPTLVGAIINGCDNGSTPCDEGQTEIMFFNSNSTSISVATINATHVINYYGSTANYTSNSPDAYTGTFSAHASTTTALNALAGCSGTFIEAATVGTIPANATFIMLPYDFCTTNYNLSAICAAFSTIYVLYYGTSGAGTSNGSWSTGGNLANYQSGANPKYITANFSALAGCSKLYYTYDAGQENNGNGSGATWSSVSTSSVSPADQSSYTASGCTLPTVLPIQLISFTAVKTQNNIDVKWETATENNNNYFALEYSLDGEKFKSYKEIKGAGNSNTIKNYDCIFSENITSSIIYFRLKQVDYNGNYKYSNVISSSAGSLTSPINIYYNSEMKKIVAQFQLDSQQEINISLYDVSGIKMSETVEQFSKGGNEILITCPETSGVYFLVYTRENQLPVHKKLAIYK